MLRTCFTQCSSSMLSHCVLYKHGNNIIVCLAVVKICINLGLRKQLSIKSVLLLPKSKGSLPNKIAQDWDLMLEEFDNKFKNNF